MKKVIYGNRTKNPAYLDLTGMFPATETKLGFFRIGDRAAAHIRCLEWRKANPDRKLIVIDMPTGINDILNIFVAQECPAEWVFGDMVDEYWLMDAHDEPVVLEGEAFMTEPIWEWWFYFNQREGFRGLKPTIRPTPAAQERVARLKEEWRLPDRYMTIQPLFDAPYALYRNRTPEFWEDLIAHVAPKIPVVVLGNPVNYSKIRTHPQAYSGWARGLSVMESIAMISGATLHVGGETGTTIWAAVMGVNTYGMYANVHYDDVVWFAEPISFGGCIRMNKAYEDAPTLLDVEDWWSKLP